MDPIKADKYLTMIEDFSGSRQSKKFKKAFAIVNNKLTALRKKYPNSLEYDFLKDAMIDIRSFAEFAFDIFFEAVNYANELELILSFKVGESEKYAKILSCLGVTPMLYFSLSDETLDFVIDNYSQIGMLTIEQLLDIDIAYNIALCLFKDPPVDYKHLKRMFNFIIKSHERYKASPHTRTDKRRRNRS